MRIQKYPSPAHARQPDAYWIGRVTDDAGTPEAVILGQRERCVLKISRHYGDRLLDMVGHAGEGNASPMLYCCHDLAEYVFSESDNFHRLGLAVPRGSVMGPEDAAKRFTLPCGVQFQDPTNRNQPIIHSAVLLGMDDAHPHLPASERAIVLHKPGREELEIVTLANAVRRYADRVSDITYYGAPREI